ncbi:FYVE and coiled-coil domain-containing protein 1 isoform X1 [Stigmatopora nigra]
MAVGASVGESQLQRIIRDLHEAVGELVKEYKENGEPITDDSTSLHKFSYRLEYLLQFDQKVKTTFLGTKKDYWDYFAECLAKIKGANDGIRFVKSISELKTSLGKGRAFIRYSLVHQRLADTLQQCLMNQRVTSDWYYARSPFMKPHHSVDIINHLYELNEIHFDVASRGYDLDSSWPTFARRTLGGAGSPGHTWKPPSRSSSINSLASNYSQQASDFLSSPDYGQGLLNDLNDSLPPCNEDVSNVEDLRLELDRSDLKQQELLNKVQELSGEAEELRGVVVTLQRQLDLSLTAQEEQRGLQDELGDMQVREESLLREVEKLKNVEKAKESEQGRLQEKLTVAEGKNIELLAKLDGVLSEKGQQAASHFDSAQKIHQLLDSLKEAEKCKMEAVAEAEEKKRQTDRTVEEMRLKETAAKDAETKLRALLKSESEEKGKLQTKVEEQGHSLEILQGDLTLREKETSNLHKQLQDLQTSLDEKEKEASEAKMRTQQQRGEHDKEMSMQKQMLEKEIDTLKKQWEVKEAELTSSYQKLQLVEDHNQSLSAERDKLKTRLEKLESCVREQDAKTEDYKTQCANLMGVNGKLLTTAKKNEDLNKEMTENRRLLEGELASLRASEKHLRKQLDDAKMTVGEKEKGLREENLKLEESLQRANMAANLSDVTLKQLEKENHSLREEQETVKESLLCMQGNLKTVQGQISELEKSLGDSQKSEASFQEQLRVAEAQLESKDMQLIEVQSRVIALENTAKDLELGKAKAEAACSKQTEMIEMVTCEKQAIEKCQLQRSAIQAKENQEAVVRLTVLEGQLEVSMKEVSRLQADILDLKVSSQRSEEEKLKSQAQLEVTESQRDELRTLTEQLKVQTEALNQKHVAELLECKKKEDVITEQRDREMAAHAELSISAAALREELATLKEEKNRLDLENTETREGLHRANTEMAELGMTICRLGAEKEEAKKHWADDTAAIEELRHEVERLEECVGQLQLENERLEGELSLKEKFPEAIAKLQEQLEKNRTKLENLKLSSQEEVEAVRFQMSSENMNHQVQLKNAEKQQQLLKSQLQEEKNTVSGLRERVCELEAENDEFMQLSGEKDGHITKTEATIRERDRTIQQLQDALTSAKNEHTAMQNKCEEFKRKLSTTEDDRQSQHVKMTAEIDDLNNTKFNLEERLIELIRDKDALWQKSDALEFEQKLRAEERWWLMDKDATHCLGCQGQFTWWLRRHHCRLCGRIFCYYCSNNYAMTKHSGKKERCCKECYSQHSAVVERFTAAELSPSERQPPPPGPGPHPAPESAPYLPTPCVTVSDPGNKPDDGTFDIITEEEVNGVYDSDANSQTTGGSFEGDQEQRPPGSLDIGVGEPMPDEPEENVATVQDSEINLLKSGELTMTVPLSIEDIFQFGDGSRELFIKSSCYSVVSVAVGDSGPTISWMFSSEPKSISFSVVYQDSAEAQVEQSKVLIPLTRCNSHKETIQGQLKVRRPGIYALIFDNSFSRFISKKVFYQLTIEKPIIYDGSDFP